MTAVFTLVYDNPADGSSPVDEQVETLRFLIEQTFIGPLGPGESFTAKVASVALVNSDPGDEHEDIGEGAYLPGI